jgi:hypothetical protein
MLQGYPDPKLLHQLKDARNGPSKPSILTMNSLNIHSGNQFTYRQDTEDYRNVSLNSDETHRPSEPDLLTSFKKLLSPSIWDQNHRSNDLTFSNISFSFLIFQWKENESQLNIVGIIFKNCKMIQCIHNQIHAHCTSTLSYISNTQQ